MKRLGRISKSVAGFTLVELMVALVIGLVVVLGAGQVFIMGLQNHNRLSDLAARQESLRFFSDIISVDVRTAVGAAPPEEDSPSLTLSYASGARMNDPYCSGGDLRQVEYILNNGGVEVRARCGESWLAYEQLIDGVDDLRFSVNSALGFIDVGVVFDRMRDEDLERASFSFSVAMRDNIVARF